jgi:transposase
MANSRKSSSKSTTASLRRFSDKFKQEALALAERLGVNTAAKELGLSSSQLYGWRQKAQLVKARGQIDQDQAREIARLKRQVAEQAEELAILKKAAAYFAKDLK